MPLAFSLSLLEAQNENELLFCISFLTMPYYKTRQQTSALEPQAQTPVLETPKKEGTDALVGYFEQLRDQYGITLPYQEKSSPSKRRKSPGHDAVKQMHFLFCCDKTGETLTHALETFRLHSPCLYTIDDKLNHLLESLTIAVNSAKKTYTPRSQRQQQAVPSSDQNSHVQITSMGPPTSGSKVKQTPGPTFSHWPPTSLQSTQIDNNQPAPPSPTLSIKAVSNKHVPKLKLDDIATYPVLPLTMAEIPKEPKAAAGITSVNTSFATAASANISFQFSEHQGSQRPASPATSFGSVNSMDGANDAPDGDHSRSQIPMSSMNDPAYHTAYREAHVGLGSHAPDSAQEAPTDEKETPSKRAKLDPQAQNDRSSSWPRTEAHEPPARALLPSPVPTHIEQEDYETTRRDSRSKRPDEHIRVSSIPIHGISGGLSLSNNLLTLPFDLRWECARLIHACGFTASHLEGRWPEPRTFESLRDVARAVAPTFRVKSKADYQDCSYHIKLNWTDSKDIDRPLFKLDLLPPNQDNLNGWQIKYGCERVLFVDSVVLRKPPAFLNFGQRVYIQERFQEMLNLPQQFLGRTWKLLHAQDKKGKMRGAADDAQSGAFSFIFFATKGDSGRLSPREMNEVVSSAVPLSENKDTAWSKANSRLHLFASRAVQALQLRPSDIEFIDDDCATEDPPDTQFNNEKLADEFKQNEIYKKDTVMNDGCSEIPEWTMRQIGIGLKLGFTPSAVQFRCAGGKGMFIKGRRGDDNMEHLDTPPVGPKVRITKSQRKVIARRDDSDSRFDEAFYMVRINAVSHALDPSYLFTAFLEILVACGVPPTNIDKLVRQQADSFSESLMSAIESREKLRPWLTEQGLAWEDSRPENGIASQAGFPKSRVEKVIQMLDSGFEPLRFTPLADILELELEQWTKKMVRNVKLKLPRSTMAYGVADPYGVLAPGEVYISFSSPFSDPITGESWSVLSGPVLVGRNPSARASDIQKAKAVYKHELSHLQDVLVFSRRGPRPLADKLSGGDYDGDRFWICWEPLLVTPFKNVPAPQQLPDPTSLGVKVDRRKLGDVISDPPTERQVCEFVKMATESRMRSTWLGMVTILHAKVVHMEGLSTPRALNLTNLKDLIIDSDKNGYTFGNDAFDKFKRTMSSINWRRQRTFSTSILMIRTLQIPGKTWTTSLTTSTLAFLSQSSRTSCKWLSRK